MLTSRLCRQISRNSGLVVSRLAIAARRPLGVAARGESRRRDQAQMADAGPRRRARFAAMAPPKENPPSRSGASPGNIREKARCARSRYSRSGRLAGHGRRRAVRRMIERMDGEARGQRVDVADPVPPRSHAAVKEHHVRSCAPRLAPPCTAPRSSPSRLRSLDMPGPPRARSGRMTVSWRHLRIAGRSRRRTPRRVPCAIPDLSSAPKSWQPYSASRGLRIYDCTTYLDPTPAGSDDPYVARPGRESFEAGHIPGADFLDIQGEFSDQTTRLRFMMPATAPSGGGVRPPRARRRRACRPLQHRHLDVGDALLVDAAVARLRRRGRARRRPRQVAGRGAPAGERPAEGLSPGPVHREAAAGLLRRQARRPGRDQRSAHGDRQRSRTAVPQRARAEPLRTAGPRPGQRERPGGDARRSRDQGLHRRSATPRRGSRPRASPRTSG